MSVGDDVMISVDPHKASNTLAVIRRGGVVQRGQRAQPRSTPPSSLSPLPIWLGCCSRPSRSESTRSPPRASSEIGRRKRLACARPVRSSCGPGAPPRSPPRGCRVAPVAATFDVSGTLTRYSEISTTEETPAVGETCFSIHNDPRGRQPRGPCRGSERDSLREPQGRRRRSCRLKRAARRDAYIKARVHSSSRRGRSSRALGFTRLRSATKSPTGSARRSLRLTPVCRSSRSRTPVDGAA